MTEGFPYEFPFTLGPVRFDYLGRRVEGPTDFLGRTLPDQNTPELEDDTDFLGRHLTLS